MKDIRTEGTDHYAAHLAAVNKENAVVSSEDILNTRGLLLVKKGARLENDTAQRLLQHRLRKPLENQVSLKDSLTGQACLSDLRALFERYPDVKQIHVRSKFDKDLQHLMVGRPLHPIVSQKLTVLRYQQRAVYDKGLFCAWLSGLVAKHMGLDGASVEAAYLAGFLHDIGFMHIDPAILNKKTRLEPAEWRAMQGHVVIGQIVLQDIPGLPGQVPRAVLEHHERCDATGYPVGKGEEDLDIFGQIVGITDTLEAIRVNQFSKNGRTLRDAMPYLQLNPTTYFFDVYRAIVDIIKDSGLQPVCVAPHDGSAFVSKVLERACNLNYASHLLCQVMQFLRDSDGVSKAKKLFRVVSHVVGLVTTSGMIREDLIKWFETLQGSLEAKTLAELNEIELMQNELIWQINNAHRVLDAFIEQHGETATGSSISLQDIRAGLQSCLENLRQR